MVIDERVARGQSVLYVHPQLFNVDMTIGRLVPAAVVKTVYWMVRGLEVALARRGSRVGCLGVIVAQNSRQLHSTKNVKGVHLEGMRRVVGSDSCN